MSERQTTTEGPLDVGRDELMSALFARLVLQQSNLAMMLLGKVAHPETGEVIKDLEAARSFIDALEMLEIKTKGNLTKEEFSLLKQSLMNLRLAFVQAVEEPEKKSGAQPQTQATRETPPSAEPAPAAPAQEESHKKFSKKY